MSLLNMHLFITPFPVLLNFPYKVMNKQKLVYLRVLDRDLGDDRLHLEVIPETIFRVFPSLS